MAYLKTGLKVSLKWEVMRYDPQTSAEFLEAAQSEEKLEASLNVSVNNESSSNTDYFSALRSPMQSVPVHNMIDTGATSSLIRRNVTNRLGCSNQVYEQSGDIVLGDAKTKLRQRRWIYLPLNIHGFRCAIRAIVVDDLTTKFVLELHFLIKFKVAIKMEQQCLVIHHREEQIFVGFEKPDYVRLYQRCTIWPKSKCVVTATTSRISKATDVLLSVIDQKIKKINEYVYVMGSLMLRIIVFS